MPAALAVRPAQRSLVLLRPTGPLVAAALLLESLLLLTNTLQLAAWRNTLALGLLLGAGYRSFSGPGQCIRFGRLA